MSADSLRIDPETDRTLIVVLEVTETITTNTAQLVCNSLPCSTRTAGDGVCIAWTETLAAEVGSSAWDVVSGGAGGGRTAQLLEINRSGATLGEARCSQLALTREGEMEAASSACIRRWNVEVEERAHGAADFTIVAVTLRGRRCTSINRHY